MYLRFGTYVIRKRAFYLPQNFDMHTLYLCLLCSHGLHNFAFTVQDQSLREVIQEVLQRHAEGVSYRERHAGQGLDINMTDKGVSWIPYQPLLNAKPVRIS